MIRIIRIPKERMAVIIGKHGKTKKKTEKSTHTKISVGEEISIEGEALDVITAENILKALGRGFSPENAFELLENDVDLRIIELPKNVNVAKRIRSRLIGTKGKSRRNIEMMTQTKISIYGRTASIIGTYENVNVAEKALKKLIQGKTHRYVYKYLEKREMTK